MRTGLPVCLGYIPVSFTFGVLAVKLGLPVWMAVFISVTNVTSAGQFAGVQLITAGAGGLELGLTELVINLRYGLMSLSLSQKIDPSVKTWQRMAIGYGITDEIFALAATEPGKLTSSFMAGLISVPVLGWTVGTLLGCITNGLLPPMLSDAMGIALYAMFIAIIIPPAKHTRAVLYTILISTAVSCMIYYIPALDFISSGFAAITATIIAASVAALLFPVNDEDTAVPEEQSTETNIGTAKEEDK